MSEEVNNSYNEVKRVISELLQSQKPQKQLLKQLFHDRDEVCQKCSPDLAMEVIKSKNFLSISEGRKLSAYFIVRVLSCPDFWLEIKESMLDSSKRNMLEFWGQTIILAWKYADEYDEEAQILEEKNPDAIRFNNKETIETNIIQDAFFCAIMCKRDISKKFYKIVKQFIDEVPQTKKMKEMFFRCLMPILWRNLDVQNDEIRISASNILLDFYPLKSEDQAIDLEYREKQHYSMERMLLDDSLPIRIEAVKKVLFNLSQNWDLFPRALIKSYLHIIVDQLAYDSVSDVRAAVYEGLEHLLPSPSAFNSVEASLRLLAKKGISDKTEKVRLSAFKLLIKLKGHKFIKLSDIISNDDLLLQLDVESSNSVQSQIVNLIFRRFYRNVEDGEPFELFKRIKLMCTVSWRASLNFHRLIYPLKLISLKSAISILTSLFIGIKVSLRKNNGNHDETVNETNELINFTGASALTFLNGTVPDLEDRLKVLKNVFDSAIVLWLTIQDDIYDVKFTSEHSHILKIVSSLLQTLEQYMNTPLIDSALVMAKFLSKDKVGRLFKSVKINIEKSDVNSPYFAHNLEALFVWDTDKFMSITESERSVSPHTPPASKRLKLEEEQQIRRSFDIIKLVLSSSYTLDLLCTKFKNHLDTLFEYLSTIRLAFGKMIVTNNLNTFNPEILMTAYEALNLIILLLRRIDNPLRSAENNEEIEPSEQELALPVNDRLMYNELKWFASILNEVTPHVPIIKMFLRCINLHMYAGEITPLVLNEVADMLREIRSRVDIYDAGQIEIDLKKSLERLNVAAKHTTHNEQTAEKIASLYGILEETSFTY